MTKQWWLLVGAFLTATTLVVVGLVLAKSVLIIPGVVVGVALYLARKQLQ